jgi:heme/copper-type cytochrome/quinol oxidase subunit 2
VQGFQLHSNLPSGGGHQGLWLGSFLPNPTGFDLVLFINDNHNDNNDDNYMIIIIMIIIMIIIIMIIIMIIMIVIITVPLESTP